jgi:hypothetical protein
MGTSVCKLINFYWLAVKCQFLIIGVMKSVMGELTDSTNRAEGFALMPVVWGLGATVGYVNSIGS